MPPQSPLLISIITATFNSAASIQACIASVASQTHRPIEHIFVDGDSKDQTVELLKAAERLYPHVRYISEKDTGVYDAMNKGLRLAKGDYIYFLGSDDRLSSPSVLEELFGKMSEPGHSVVYGNVKIIGAGFEWAKNGTLYDGAFDLPKLISRNICHQTIFYPRSTISAIGQYDTRYRVTADWDYNLRAFAHTSFEYREVTVADYNTTGFSSQHDDLHFVYNYAEDLIKRFGGSLFSRRYKGAAEFFGEAGFMRLRQRKRSGLRYLAAACYHSPAYIGEVLGKLFRRSRTHKNTQ